jgi:hypothetical protein
MVERFVEKTEQAVALNILAQGVPEGSDDNRHDVRILTGHFGKKFQPVHSPQFQAGCENRDFFPFQDGQSLHPVKCSQYLELAEFIQARFDAVEQFNVVIDYEYAIYSHL